jgi:hypothetical protein
MIDNHQEYIVRLRDAASKRQWNECRESVRLLLPALPQSGIVHILTRQIKRFLSDMSHTDPNEPAISDEVSALENNKSLEKLLSTSNAIYSLLEIRCNEPGINNFRNALKCLTRAGTIDNSSDDYFDALVDVLSDILMAILDHAWGNQNYDLWRKSFWQESRDDAFIRVKHFWPDPKTIELNKELWNIVADDVEAALTAGAE